MLAHLRTDEGGFASALDADTEGVEGRFYVWTPDAVRAVVEPDEVRTRAAHASTGGGSGSSTSIASTSDCADCSAANFA